MIDMNKNYETKDGREVRVLCVDAGGEKPVIALISDVLGRHYLNGRYCDTYESASDLVEVKPRIKRTIWVNVYPDTVGNNYESKESADDSRGSNRIACVKLEIDCEEGEGL